MPRLISAKAKLECPYCHAKQEYKALDYFIPDSEDWTVSEHNQCEECDQCFSAILLHGRSKVGVCTNGLTYVGVQNYFGYDTYRNGREKARKPKESKKI